MNRKNNKWISRAGCALVTCGLMFTSVAEAGLYFWDNGSGVNSDYATPANWNPDGVPGNGDLAVANNSALPAIQITSNVSADSLRLSDGGAVNHTAGTLTIANGVGPDNGLWVGEFGPAPVSYTLSGGVIHINDPGDGFMVGRGGSSQATFTFNSGSVTNTVGDTHIGLDGVAYWYQSAGNFAGAGVQISRFASPYVLVQLSGTARWDVGLVLLADGHGVFNPRNAGLVDLQLIGPNVVFNCNGLVMQDEGQLTFDGTGGGISTMHLGGGQLLLNNGKLFLNNLPTPGATGQTIVLMDNIGPYTGVDNQFDNAPNGTIYNAGSIDWQIQYQVTNIVLVSVPDCVAPSISVQPQDKQVVVGGSVTLTVGAGGTGLLYQWQTNGVDISGANSSSLTFNPVAYSDAATYRVIVTQACSGASATSSNAVLSVLAPWTFCTWDNGGGDNLAGNPNNWNPDKMPSVQDFCGDFITSLLIINTNLSVDTFRTGGGGTVLHTNGTLTIVNGIWTDNGFWAGEFGANCSYTLDGGKIVVLDPNDGFMVARNGDSQSLFTFLSGSITNTVGDTHIGLDGLATWKQSGGTFRGAGVQIGRFANPGPVLTELSGHALWNVGLVLLADGHAAFSPRNTNDVLLTLKGPNVSYQSTGLVLQNEGKLIFDGTGGGLSTMDFGGGQFLLNYGNLYLTNLPSVQSNGQQIVLMNNIGAYTGANTQFGNAPDGTVYPSAAKTSGWQIKYHGTNIVLVALPLIKITSTSVGGGNVTMVFTAGTSDTTTSFVLQGASAVNGLYADVSPAATITQLSPGVFQAVTPVSGPDHFYRIRRL